MTATEVPTGTGTAVCRLEQIRRESGVAALVEGEAVAIFRTYDDELFALSNLDPFSGASVLSRGIVGTRTLATVDDAGLTNAEEIPFVASPLLKQPFDLRTGSCLDDPSVAVATYEVSLLDGVVVIGARQDRDPASHAR